MVLEPGTSYGLVLEYMEYGEILNFVQEFEPPWERKLIMIQDIVSGVCYLHSLNPSIIHGDLKPQNILLSGDLQAKICDFGFAEWKEYCNSHSGHEIRLGTIPYVPPETWEDRFLRKNEQFDVYSIGICIWEILVVRKPYEIMLPDVIRESVLSGKRPDLKLIPPEVSNKISKLIERCWDQIATNRPTSFEITSTVESEIKKLRRKGVVFSPKQDECFSKWRSSVHSFESSSSATSDYDISRKRSRNRGAFNLEIVPGNQSERPSFGNHNL